MTHRLAAARILALLSAAILLLVLPSCRRDDTPSGGSLVGSATVSPQEPVSASPTESTASEPSPVSPAPSSSASPSSGSAPSESEPPQSVPSSEPQSSSSSEPPVETRPTSFTYKKVNGASLFLDYYPPLHSTAEESPLLLYFHGGDWSGGDRRPTEPFRTFFRAFREQGYAVASADYRLLGDPDVGLEEMLQDTSDAVRYLIRHADWFKIDPSKIALIGQGAGAHLALMTGFFPERYTESSEFPETPAQVGCIVTLGAPTDLIAAAQDDGFPLKQAVEALLGAPYDEKNEEVKARYEAASPAKLLSPSAPSLCLIHGRNDEQVPFNQLNFLYDTAMSQVHDIIIKSVGNAGHTLESTNEAEISPTMEEITDAVLDFVHTRLFS